MPQRQRVNHTLRSTVKEAAPSVLVLVACVAFVYLMFMVPVIARSTNTTSERVADEKLIALLKSDSQPSIGNLETNLKNAIRESLVQLLEWTDLSSDITFE